MKGGINTYTYVRGNPLSYSDPKGLAPPRSQAGTGFPSLFPPGPFDDSWNRSRDNAALALEEWLNPSASAEIIDFAKKKKERDDAKEKERLKNCPPEDDGYCEREQKQLLSRQILIVNMRRTDLVPLWQYRIQIQNYNFDAESHNRMCPDHQVGLFPDPGPVSSLD